MRANHSFDLVFNLLARSIGINKGRQCSHLLVSRLLQNQLIRILFIDYGELIFLILLFNINAILLL